MKYNPPYGIVDPDGAYINGDPSIGRAGSIPPAESIEYPQREIVNLIADAAFQVPANTDLRQLGKAVQSQQLNSKDDGGTANQYQVTMQPPPGVYYRYMMVITLIGNANTGASTLNVNAMGPKAIAHHDGSPLSAGELKANSVTCFEYDGINFQIAWTTARFVGTTVEDEPDHPGGPTFLTAPMDLYVNDATGSDTLYDGTTAAPVAGTLHGPYKTIQKACDQIPKFNQNGYKVTIHVADGTYAGFGARPQNGSGGVDIIGNTANPAACLVNAVNKSAANFAQALGINAIRGFKLQCSGVTNPNDPLCLITAQGSGVNVFIGEMEFGASLGGAIVSMQGATISNNPANCVWRVTGGASGAFGPYTGSFLQAQQQGQINYHGSGGPNIQIANAVTFAGAFVIAMSFGMVGVLYSGLSGAASVTGAKFLSDNLSLISTAAAGVNYWPGSIAGTAVTARGGYYN